MTVSSTTTKKVYLCDSVSTNFVYNFKIWEDGDLGVYLFTIADSTTITLRLDVDYSVNGAGDDAGGSIDLIIDVAGPSIFTAAPTDSYKLVIMRELDLTQPVDYAASGPFPAETQERALDRLTYLIQQLDEKVNRCFLRDITQTGEIITDLDATWYILTRINLNDGYIAGNLDMQGYLIENITGIEDNDNDTGVYVEQSDDEDKVRIKTGGTQRGQFDADGLTLASGASVNEFSTDGTFGGNSDDAIPTEKAVKTYVTINTLAEKTSLTADDLFLIEDSAASNARKKVKWSNIPYINAAQYYELDSMCISAVDNGSLAIDLSKLSNTLTLISLAETDLVDGKVGKKCYNFDGTNDYVLIAHSALQAGMAALTIEAWLYLDTLNASQGMLVNKTDGYIYMGFSNNQFSGTIITGTGTEAIAIGYVCPTATWIYLVVAWDNSSAATVYINGSSIGNGDNAGNGTVSDSANGIYIGCDANTNNKWDGKIDGVRILRRKMGATEVLKRYNMFK